MGDPVIPLARRVGAPAVGRRRVHSRRVGLREMGASGVRSAPDLDALIALDRRLAAIEALLRALHADVEGDVDVEGDAHADPDVAEDGTVVGPGR